MWRWGRMSVGMREYGSDVVGAGGVSSQSSGADQCGWYDHHTIEDPVHHDDLVSAAVVRMVKMRRASLDHVDLGCQQVSAWVPHG